MAHLSTLSKDEAIELGTEIGALIGLGIEGEESMDAGAEGATACSEEARDVVEEIPNDSAAALVLIEHQWAVPLRDAVARAGGFHISDGFISPLDLVEVGLHSQQQAEELHTLTMHMCAPLPGFGRRGLIPADRSARRFERTTTKTEAG